MDARKGNIYEILNGNKQFLIPVYQRYYSWDLEQCRRLWNDIVDMQKKGKVGHFVGSIVNIAEQAMPTGVQKYMIIDGQQRMTTLTLLLLALRDYAIKNPEDKTINARRIDNMLLKNEYLCSFNSDGQCRISLSEPLGLHQEQLIPNYMTTYYCKLQKFFDAVKTLRIQAEGAFETVIAEEYSPRLISFNDFDKTSETVSFDLRRVCRLTHEYVFYLYKLYLEYRGRKPFQTINLIRQEDTALPVLLNKQESGQYLSFRCVPIPNKNNRKNWCWIIDASELNRVLGLLGLPILSKTDQDVILKDDSTELNLEMGKKAKIVKAKQKVYFEYHSK